MSNLSYIADNIDELLDNAPDGIQELVGGGKVEETTITLSNNYKIPVKDQVALSNVISFTLIGAIQPTDVLKALQDLVHVSTEDAARIANDLEHSIFEAARESLFKRGPEEIKTLEYQGAKNTEELRKQIMSTTKAEGGLQKDQSTPTPKASVQKKPIVIAPGSRAQLLEQLQVIGTIPNEDEISTRLSHIQEQIKAMKDKEGENSLDSKIALKSFMFGEKGKEVADTTISKTTYSVPPTKYNVDPYKEVTE